MQLCSHFQSFRHPAKQSGNKELSILGENTVLTSTDGCKMLRLWFYQGSMYLSLCIRRGFPLKEKRSDFDVSVFWRNMERSKTLLRCCSLVRERRTKDMTNADSMQFFLFESKAHPAKRAYLRTPHAPVTQMQPLHALLWPRYATPCSCPDNE